MSHSSSAIHHYTPLSNLHKILTSDGIKLWATRYGFFSDKREYVWAFNKIRPELEEIARQNGEVFDHEHNVHPYIVSFTDLEDDLTMWRLYANEGKGVCLTFDLNEMNICPENLMSHMSVVYANDMNLKEKIESALCIYRQEFANVKVTNDYREIPAFVKHEKYEAEQEYRVVKLVGDGFDIGFESAIRDYDEYSEEIKFRAREDMLVPYIKLTFPKTSLRAIRIGYNCDIESVEKAISLLKDLHGYNNVEITKSSINNYPKNEKEN